MSVEDQIPKLTSWIGCAESAAETLTQLDIALLGMANHTKLFQEGKTHESLSTSTKEVLKSLQNLQNFVGQRSSSAGKDSVFLLFGSRNKEIVHELHNECRRAVKEIQKLETIYESLKSESCTLETPIKYKEKVLNQWPKNSQEFQIYLKQNLAAKNSPLNNSSQSAFQREEREKKVRFNVSYESSVSFNSPGYASLN